MIKILKSTDNIPCLCEPILFVTWQVLDKNLNVIDEISGDPNSSPVYTNYFVDGSLDELHLNLDVVDQDIYIKRTILDSCGDSSDYMSLIKLPNFDCEDLDTYITGATVNHTNTGTTITLTDNNIITPNVIFDIPECCITAVTQSNNSGLLTTTIQQSNGSNFTFPIPLYSFFCEELNTCPIDSLSNVAGNPNEGDILIYTNGEYVPTAPTDCCVSAVTVNTSITGNTINIEQKDGQNFSIDIPECCIIGATSVSTTTGTTISLNQTNGLDYSFSIPECCITGITTSQYSNGTNILIEQTNGLDYNIQIPVVSTQTNNVISLNSDGAFLNCDKIKYSYSGVPIVTTVVNQSVFVIPSPPSGEIDLNSIQLFANGLSQAPLSPNYGFTKTLNGGGSVTLMTTQSWGSTSDPCIILINYLITENCCE